MDHKLPVWQNNKSYSLRSVICHRLSRLGPLLFSVFTDDLGDQCENDLFLYADSSLFCVIGSAGDADVASASLNRDLKGMKICADRWKVTFEP